MKENEKNYEHHTKDLKLWFLVVNSVYLIKNFQHSISSSLNPNDRSLMNPVRKSWLTRIDRLKIQNEYKIIFYDF